MMILAQGKAGIIKLEAGQYICILVFSVAETSWQHFPLKAITSARTSVADRGLEAYGASKLSQETHCLRTVKGSSFPDTVWRNHLFLVCPHIT